jgi:hypothetical protein
MTLLLRGRPWIYGATAMAALVSPTVMMGVERGNLDLLILTLVGVAALVYGERGAVRAGGAVAFAAYLLNTSACSDGTCQAHSFCRMAIKRSFGFDHILSEAGLSPAGLADTWWPAFTAAFVLVFAAGLATNNLRHLHGYWSVDGTVAGTAFLFGAGIYCGTYLLGTNSSYIG